MDWGTLDLGNIEEGMDARLCGVPGTLRQALSGIEHSAVRDPRVGQIFSARN